MWKSLSFCSKRVLWSCYIGKILHVMVTVMPSDRCRRMNTTTTAASSATAATDTAVYPIAGLAVAAPTAASSMPSTETADTVKTKLPRPSLQHPPLRPFAWPLPIQTKTHLNWWDRWHHTFSFLPTFRRATTDADRRQRQNRPCLPQTAHPDALFTPPLKRAGIPMICHLLSLPISPWTSFPSPPMVTWWANASSAPLPASPPPPSPPPPSLYCWYTLVYVNSV